MSDSEHQGGVQRGLNVTESQQTDNKRMNSVLLLLHHPFRVIVGWKTLVDNLTNDRSR